MESLLRQGVLVWIWLPHSSRWVCLCTKMYYFIEEDKLSQMEEIFQFILIWREFSSDQARGKNAGTEKLPIKDLKAF